MRKLSELNNEELGKVFDANEELRQNVIDDMIDSEMDYLSEIIDCFSDYLRNYEYGFNSPAWVTIKNDYGFIQGVIQATNDYGFLSDDKILEVKKLFYAMENEEDSDKQDEMQQELSETTKDYVTSQLQAMTDYCDLTERAEEYFLEFYKDARMEDEDFEVAEDFELFENIHKSYRRYQHA